MMRANLVFLANGIVSWLHARLPLHCLLHHFLFVVSSEANMVALACHPTNPLAGERAKTSSSGSTRFGASRQLL